jgi:hypothetical protein
MHIKCTFMHMDAHEMHMNGTSMHMNAHEMHKKREKTGTQKAHGMHP